MRPYLLKFDFTLADGVTLTVSKFHGRSTQTHPERRILEATSGGCRRLANLARKSHPDSMKRRRMCLPMPARHWRGPVGPISTGDRHLVAAANIKRTKNIGLAFRRRRVSGSYRASRPAGCLPPLNILTRSAAQSPEFLLVSFGRGLCHFAILVFGEDLRARLAKPRSHPLQMQNLNNIVSH